MTYIAYIILYVLLVFVTLLNFLLAIVVNFYTVVQDSVKEEKTEMNVLIDILDIIRTQWVGRKNRWPRTFYVWQYLAHAGQGLAKNVDELKAITAEELVSKVVDTDGNQVFKSLDQAFSYMRFYRAKIEEDGINILEETRETMLFQNGEYFNQSVDEHDAIAHRELQVRLFQKRTRSSSSSRASSTRRAQAFELASLKHQADLMRMMTVIHDKHVADMDQVPKERGIEERPIEESMTGPRVLSPRPSSNRGDRSACIIPVAAAEDNSRQAECACGCA